MGIQFLFSIGGAGRQLSESRIETDSAEDTD